MAETEVSGTEITLLDIGVVLAESWRLLVIVPLLVGLIALGISFRITPVFTASTRILPPQQQSTAAAMLTQQFGALSGLAGVAAGLRNPLDQQVALIRSRTVADRVIARFDLGTAYQASRPSDARAELAARTNVRAAKDGLIDIEVDDHDPKRAAAIANAYVEELLRLTNELALGEAAQRRVFFERQLNLTKDNLIAAEVALNSSGVPENILKAEPRMAAESVGRLKAAVMSAELRLSMLRNYMAETNPDYRQAQQELNALRGQMARAERHQPPGAAADGSGYIARYREFKYQEALFEMLAKQYELARFDEARESNMVMVIDPAVVPERKSRPKKASIAVAATAVTLILTLGFVFLRRGLQVAAADPSNATKLSRIRRALPGARRAGRVAS
jgi:tyrosine-protein kinase Etk/Wzc